MSSSPFQITPSLTFQEVLEICNQNGKVFGGGEIVTMESLKAPPTLTLLSAGKGFCSDVYRIEFSITEKNDYYSIVAKIPRTKNFDPSSSNNLPIEELNRQKQINFKMISELHSNEITFYEFYTTKYCDNRDYQEINLKIPKYFYGREMSETQEGLILMEDLSKNCSKQKFHGLQFLNDQQIKESIIEIAKFQAWGFTILPEAQEALGKLETFKSVLNFYFNRSIDTLAEKNYSWLTEERLNKLRKAAKSEEFNYGCMGEFHLPLVLCHDDFWAGNLLISDNDADNANSTGSLITILDWQIARYASPTQDLAALLALGLPSDQRRALEKDYVRFYFDSLKHYLDVFKIVHDKGYRSFEFNQIFKVYKISLKIAIFRVIITWENYDTLNPCINNENEEKETPLQNLIRCLLEDL